ncbi:MAG: GNAT family N-acetyltransferase [Ignavibacteriales bacterium]|nr:GNAT family N-acetyltransferase [Ignavibacteriales bacterium]
MDNGFDMAEFLEVQEDEQSLDRSSKGQNLTIEVIRTIPEFESLAHEWDELVERSNATVYQTHEWLSLWWKHFGSGHGRTLHIILFRRDRALLGIAPFFLDTQWLFRFRLRRRLRLMGCDIMAPLVAPFASEGGPSDYSDIIALTGDEDAIAMSLVQYFQDESHIFDEIECKNISEESVVFKSVVPLLERKRLYFKTNKTDICPRLSVQSSFEELVQTLPADLRRRLRHALKEFEQSPIHSLEYVSSPKMLATAFRDLVGLHQQRWNRLGYLGLFADRRFEAFQSEVAMKFLKKGWLWFGTAYMGGVCIGARLGFKFGSRIYDYLSGFDDRQPWSRSRPGLALLGAMIKDAIESGCTTVDFLRGNEPYKFEFTSRAAQNHSLVIPLSTGKRKSFMALARLLQVLQNIYRRMLKEILIMQVHAKQGDMRTFPGAYGKFLGSRLFTKVKIPAPLKDGALLVRKALGRGSKQITTSNRQQKIERFLLNAANLIDDNISRVTARFFLLYCNGVGQGARTLSRPVIENRGHIVIGKNLFINSRKAQASLVTGIKGRIEIGDDVRIEPGATVFAQRLVKIGNRVQIGSGVNITDSDADLNEQWYSAMTAEPIIIGDDVKIEENSSVLKGVTIGKETIIKDESIVSMQIPPHVIVGGVPARVLYHRSSTNDFRSQPPIPKNAPEPKHFQQLVDEHFQETASYWKATYDAQNLDGKIYQRRLAVVLALIDTLGLSSEARVLEVGCGAGLLAIGLARRGFSVEAIDSVDAMVTYTRARTLETGFQDRIIVRKADIHQLDHENETFDLVIAIGVVPWLHSPETAIQEMARVMKLQGHLIMTADNEWRLNHVLDPRL